jgi:NADH-quinone oxidoreductase subunit C
MELIIQELEQVLQKQFQDKITISNDSDMPIVEVSPELVFDFIKFLKENENTGFNFLTDVCGVHYPENESDKKLVVVYHLHNWITNVRIRVKTYLSETNPVVDSVTSLYESANWQERETFDFYGIVFKNHPDLRRILNMDEMLDFPMRKEFKLEDEYRTDKDNRYFGRELSDKV